MCSKARVFSAVVMILLPPAALRGAACSPPTPPASPLPTSFTDCLKSTGSGSVCQLPTGTYAVPQTLTIERSGITVRGFTASSSILRRTADIPRMMTILPGVGNVTIRDLTFDGNRWGISGLSCKPGNSPYYDLELCPLGSCVNAGTVTVQYVNFTSAPGDALRLDGYSSTVSYSNFGYQGQCSASRSTAVRLYNSASGAYYNTINYAGTAAINVQGSSQYVYGNSLWNNRYEQSDNSAGGQLTLWSTSVSASVAANVIDGNYWRTTGSLVNGCSTVANGANTGPSGVEAYGSSHYFYNNGIIRNWGAGMQIGGSNQTGPITISRTNPYNLSDIVRCIRRNGGGFPSWALLLAPVTVGRGVGGSEVQAFGWTTFRYWTTICRPRMATQCA